MAFSYGYMTGFDSTHFGGESPISREQLITVLYRYSKDHYDTLGNSPASQPLYPDIDEISPFAYKAVYWGAGEGLIGSNGRLSPKDLTTRAQAAKMFSLIDAIFDKYRENTVPDPENILDLAGLNARITLPEEADYLYETMYGSPPFAYKKTLYAIRNVLGGRININIFKFTSFDYPGVFQPAWDLISDTSPNWNDPRSVAQKKIDTSNEKYGQSVDSAEHYLWGGEGENKYCFVTIDYGYLFSIYIRNLDTPTVQYFIDYDFYKDGNTNVNTEGLKEKCLEITHQITDNVEFY